MEKDEPLEVQGQLEFQGQQELIGCSQFSIDFDTISTSWACLCLNNDQCDVTVADKISVRMGLSGRTVLLILSIVYVLLFI